MGFPRQEYWNGLPWPLPRVFPTQGLNPHLLHCRQIHVDVWQKPTQYCYCKAIILPLKTIKKKKQRLSLLGLMQQNTRDQHFKQQTSLYDSRGKATIRVALLVRALLLAREWLASHQVSSSSYKDTLIPARQPYPRDLSKSFPKAPSPNTIMLEVMASI